MGAVLYTALYDAANFIRISDRRRLHEVREWFAETDDQWLFSLTQICLQFGFDASRLRRRVLTAIAMEDTRTLRALTDLCFKLTVGGKYGY